MPASNRQLLTVRTPVVDEVFDQPCGREQLVA